MAKRYKCPYCEQRHEREKLITHIEDDHEDLIPQNETPTQVVFNSINKKTHGTCVVCKKPTKWNEKAGRYDRLCGDPKCREKLRQEFKTNSLAKHGTYNFTKDPEFQEKMLKGRKISSTYKFTDGGKVDYVGSYEKKFLEFVDKVMNIESKDIIGPGPTIEYEYNGEIHYWITDFYYVPGNLVLDIKDGGKNPNTRPMEEYREKQIAKEAAIRKLKKYNYLRLTDNNFGQFLEVLADLKYMALDLKERQLVTKINEASIQELSAAMSTVPPMYSSDASVLVSVDNRGDERIALSSLDFNDKLLLDDELDGIVKISKKKFKEKYNIKEQFLIKKDESYYNLLEAFKNKDACIYEGIYKNLSSFDTILTENQIYFDDKFIKVEKDKVLEEMTNALSKVNESIFVIGESTLIRNDKLELDNVSESSFNINEFYNELKVELESNQDGYFMITPSNDKEDLDDQYQKFNAQNDDQKKKADNKSVALYGMNNYDHYHILLSKITKGTKDDELNGLEYNRHDETIVKENYDLYNNLPKDFECKTPAELDEKIQSAIEFNTHTLGRVIIYPTQDANELESLYMKYMALGTDNKASSDDKAQELFGKTNRQIYEFLKDNVVEPKRVNTDKNLVNTDKTVEQLQSSLFTNDTPLLTPKELNTEVHEDYSCFNNEDGETIKAWRESYSLLGLGVKQPDYNKKNLDRINILRKCIYENNTDGIIQCGWIPGIEFNSENRVKASIVVRNKIEEFNIIKYESLGESFITEASNTDDKKAVSIVLVSGKSLLGKTIKKVQNIDFSHVSVSLDEDLKKIYSYNMRNNFNGLAYESISNYIKEGVDRIGVYTFLVSKSVYNKIEKVLDNFNLYRNKTKYSIINLITIPFNIDLDLDMNMVCSEFVDKLLKLAGVDITNKKSSLVSPKDFISTVNNNSNIVEIFNDHPKKYNPSIIKKRIQNLKKSNIPVVCEAVEYDESYIEEAKSFPIQFDSDGNLIIKNIRRIDFEQEYANSHRLLMEYDKTKSYEPMKFELAKMQFLITLMEKKIYQKDDKELVKTRARYLNDFKKYLKVLTNNDRSFNFTEYYEQSPFNDAMIKIDKSTLKYGWKALKYILTK